MAGRDTSERGIPQNQRREIENDVKTHGELICVFMEYLVLTKLLLSMLKYRSFRS